MLWTPVIALYKLNDAFTGSSMRGFYISIGFLLTLTKHNGTFFGQCFLQFGATA